MIIHPLDLNFQGYPQTIASYLVIGSGGPVLVETGPRTTLPTLIAQLKVHDYSPSDIGHVLVTHIHLDHAGAAGWWAQQGAHVYVHHVGAPHLIDPSKLLASASRIYKDQMMPLWGEVVPAPASQVTSVYDGDPIEVNGLTFTALNTPGHAYHHHVYQLENCAFTGDVAGIHLPGVPFVDLPAPPPEFNLDLWLSSIQRLLGESFDAIYPTHFGRVAKWRSHLAALSNLIQEAADLIKTNMLLGRDRAHIVDEYLNWIKERTEVVHMPVGIFQQYEVISPPEVSVDGMMRYWKKRLPLDDIRPQ